MGEGEIFDCIAASVRRDQLGPDLNISGLSCNSPADWAERRLREGFDSFLSVLFGPNCCDPCLRFQLLTTRHISFTAQTRVQIPPGTPIES
jgi:hypothetical protein